MAARPRSRLRGLLVNLAVMAGSVVIFLAVCEFVVFRFVLPGSDVPRNAFINELVRYAPGQSGHWRVRDDVDAPFSINGEGWNSPLPTYPRERRPGVRRIAFVGDSFVEALQVPFDRSFAEVTAEALGSAGPVEAYRYGIAGAPMSQYVQMIQQEVGQAQPDTIVVLLVHNDFDESFVFRPGRYTSSFRKLDVQNGKVIGELPPTPWRPGPVEFLRRTATSSFFLYRWQVRPQAIVDAILGPARAAEGNYAANVEIGAVLVREADVKAATDHVVGRLKALAQAAGARLQLVMDGDRAAIEAGRGDSPALRLNAIAAAAAARHGVPFLDLHPVFAAEWAAKRKPFAFASDAHWNAYGHAVAGRAIAAALAAQH